MSTVLFVDFNHSAILGIYVLIEFIVVLGSEFL